MPSCHIGIPWSTEIFYCLCSQDRWNSHHDLLICDSSMLTSKFIFYVSKRKAISQSWWPVLNYYVNLINGIFMKFYVISLRFMKIVNVQIDCVLVSREIYDSDRLLIIPCFRAETCVCWLVYYGGGIWYKIACPSIEISLISQVCSWSVYFRTLQLAGCPACSSFGALYEKQSFSVQLCLYGKLNLL